MTKEDWIRKLTSRKFWAAIAGFVTGLIVFFKQPTADGNSITALIMAFGSLVAYIVGEGLIDAADAGANQTVTHLTSDDWNFEEWEEPEEHPPEEENK